MSNIISFILVTIKIFMYFLGSPVLDCGSEMFYPRTLPQITHWIQLSSDLGVLRGSLVKFLTLIQESWVELHWILWVFRGSVLGQDTSEPQPRTGETH